MSLIGSVSNMTATPYANLKGMEMIKPSAESLLSKAAETASTGKTQETSFGGAFEKLIEAVDAKQTEANKVTRQVLLGETDQLHQSVIAMQEASVAFSLMVEVRNKLVDSYQELMRMPV